LIIPCGNENVIDNAGFIRIVLFKYTHVVSTRCFHAFILLIVEQNNLVFTKQHTVQKILVTQKCG